MIVRRMDLLTILKGLEVRREMRDVRSEGIRREKIDFRGETLGVRGWELGVLS